ncbi:Uncharacterised protein [uncultured archaeon]|nr:Uncharacterised protein [uncultured archaeon]
MAQIDIKTFILLCILVLAVPLFIANQSLSGNDITSTLELSLNSSANWTQLRLEGATITGVEVLDNTASIRQSNDALFMEGPGRSEVKLGIRVTQDPVRFFLSKDVMGQAFAEIKGIGRLGNINQPLTIPVSLRTSSSLSKIDFRGLIIQQSTVEGLKGAAYPPIIRNDSISLANPLGNDVELDLLARVSVYDEFPIIVLEKGDKGTLQAEVGNYAYSNNKTGKRTIRNLPVTVEMTSNMTQIFFDGGEISQGKIIKIDNQSLQSSIIGDNFLFLKYGHDGNTFRRASLLLDLNYSDKSGLTIYKSNSGFVGVTIGDRSYFLVNSSETDSELSKSYALGEIKYDQKSEKNISVPLYIETTSNWSDISLQGLDGVEIAVVKAEGNISHTAVSGGTISIVQRSTENSSLAKVEAIVKADSQDYGRMRIEKGIHGYTKVTVGKIAVYYNTGGGKDDSKNRMFFPLPLLPKAIADSGIVYNPVAFILPLYSELYDQGLTIEDTQPKEVYLSIPSQDIPKQGLSFSIPAAEGVRIYLLIALLILLVFSVTMLRLDVHFGLSDTPFRDAVCRRLERLGKLPLSSALIIEMLAAIAVIPLLLIDVRINATLLMMVAYLGLAVAVILRLAGTGNGPCRDTREWSCARKEAFALLLGAAAYFALFELLSARPEIGPNISRILLLGAAIVLWLLYLIIVHHDQRGYREVLWNLTAGNLESMPISSVIILETLILLAATPFLLLSVDALANSAAILAYLLLVAGVALRFVEMKGLLNIDKQKEILIKILCLAVLPAAGIIGASELTEVNSAAGQIFLGLILAGTMVLLAFIFLFLNKRAPN